MKETALKTKNAAVRFLSMFLCVLILLSAFSDFGTGDAATTPLLYINDTVFANWQDTPPQKLDGVVYIPITMFIDLEYVYYFSNPKTGSFYLQNEVTKEYLSFSLKTNDAYNGKTMIKIDILVFNNTIYLPAIQTANNLGLYLEMNTDNTIVRLSDESAKMQFSKLIAMYTPVETPPVTDPTPETPSDDTPPAVDNTPPVVDDTPPTPPPVQTKPEEPVINPCEVYICFRDPDVKNLESLMIALKSGRISATFFLSSEYIDANPEKVLSIYTAGHSIALYAKNGHDSFDGFYGEITSANDYLERIIKQKTRLVALDGSENEYKAQIEQKGYLTHSYEITPSKYIYYSKTLSNTVITALNSHARARVLMNTDITSVTALYDIAKHINSYSIITSYAIDETF